MIDASTFLIFYDPVALAIVGGGTLLATAARGPIADTINAVRALAVLFRRPFEFGDARAELAEAERVGHARGLLAVPPGLMRDPDVVAGFAAVTDGAVVVDEPVWDAIGIGVSSSSGLNGSMSGSAAGSTT